VNRSVKQETLIGLLKPHDQRLGELSSTRRRKEDVLDGGLPHLACALALGTAQTPE